MRKVLIVDDEESIRILYTDEFEEEGYEVAAIGDGSRLMAFIERERPDLIVLDIRLGKHNGLDLLQEIRNSYYDLPVVVCTAYGTYKNDSKSAAADYFVVKSFNLEELKLTVKKALEGRGRIISGKPGNQAKQMASLF